MSLAAGACSPRVSSSSSKKLFSSSSKKQVVPGLLGQAKLGRRLTGLQQPVCARSFGEPMLDEAGKTHHHHHLRAADSIEYNGEFSHTHTVDLRESIREDIAFIVHRESHQIVQLIQKEIQELGKTLSKIAGASRSAETGLDNDAATGDGRGMGQLPWSPISASPRTMSKWICQNPLSPITASPRTMSKWICQKSVEEEGPEDCPVQFDLQCDTTGQLDVPSTPASLPSTPASLGLKAVACPSIASREMEVELAFRAAYSGDVGPVRSFLDRQGDPSIKISSFQGHKKIYTDCNLLPIAAMGGSIDVVRLLLERQANVDGEYGFSAGGLGMHWRGRTTDAAVTQGHLEILKEIVRFNGDLHAVSSNQANLIWQASYFGHKHILDYLLNHEVSCHIRAQSQDIAGVSYCPLHIATLQGHPRVVRSLLAAKADVQSKTEQGHSPVIDAIICGRPELVRLLISHGALLNEYIVGDPLQASDFSGCHVLEYLFVERNPVLVRAAALGLQTQEEQMKHLSTDHVLQFMKRGDTDAVKAIFKAIFRRREIICRGEHHEKISLRTAVMPRQVISDSHAKGNVHVSESFYRFSDISELFRKRQAPDKPLRDFFEDLLPHTKPWADIRGHHFTTVVVHESLVPDFHNDMRVVHAIKMLSQFDPALETKQGRAIIAINWHAHQMAFTAQIVNHALLLLVFIGVSLLLLEACAGDCTYCERTHSRIQILARCGIPFVVYEGVMELAELVVAARYGWLWRCLTEVSRDVELLRIFADGWVLATIGIWVGLGGYATRIVFCIGCYAKWMRLLHVLSHLRPVGINVIPIMHALRTIVPFICVMLFFLGGMWHAYIALRFGELHLFDAFTEILTFSFNVESVPKLLKPPYPTNASGDIQKRIIDLLVIGITLVLPVALMNTFIAALVNSYTQGIENIERLYQHRRAQAAFSMMACRRCFDVLFRNPWKIQDDTDQSSRKILWYTHERHMDGLD